MNSATDFDRLRVVLVATRNPLNIGAAARAMSNFGVGRLRVVNPWEPAFREARSAVGASAVLAQAEEYSSVADAVADCTLVVGTTAGRRRELHQPLRTLPEGARLIRKRLRTGTVALLFGSEKRGLANEDFNHCDWLMQILTRETQPSMNLGQAVAVCLYEIARQRSAGLAEKVQRASAGDLERITGYLVEALDSSGYIPPRTASATEQKTRRLVRRLQLSAQDATAWLGMLRQMAWKLRK